MRMIIGTPRTYCASLTGHTRSGASEQSRTLVRSTSWTVLASIHLVAPAVDASYAPCETQGHWLTTPEIRGIPVQPTEAEGVHGAFPDVMHCCIAMNDQLHRDRNVRTRVGTKLWDEARCEQEWRVSSTVTRVPRAGGYSRRTMRRASPDLNRYYADSIAGESRGKKLELRELPPRS